MGNCTCKSNSLEVFPLEGRVPWNEPCPLCTKWHGLEVKEQLSSNIRPDTKLDPGEHTIIYTLTYEQPSEPERKTKCFQRMQVLPGMFRTNHHHILYSFIVFVIVNFRSLLKAWFPSLFWFFLITLRAPARTLIGGVYIHIFMFCPADFFSN